MNTLPTSIAPEDQIKSLTLSYFDYHLLLVSLCHSIDTNTDLLVLLRQRPSTAPDRSEVVARLRTDSANLKRLYERLVGDQA